MSRTATVRAEAKPVRCRLIASKRFCQTRAISSAEMKKERTKQHSPKGGHQTDRDPRERFVPQRPLHPTAFALPLSTYQVCRQLTFFQKARAPRPTGHHLV